MSRQIKFRGLRSDGNGWVKGWLIGDAIATTAPFAKRGVSISRVILHEVKRETIGQYVMTNDDGVDVFEGDRDRDGWIVVSHEYGFMLKHGNNMYKPLYCDFEVHGNIHEQ